MTAYTSAQSGNWSSSSTWSPSGVPGDGDTVTIQAGHTVIFDVDQSSFASGLAGLTVNGTLKWATDVVTYLKMASNVHIDGTGTLQVGEPDNPIQRPAPGSQTRATIKLEGSGQVKVPNFLCYGWDDRTNRTTLAANADSGATQIILTDDMNLQAGDQIVIGAGTVDGPLTETSKGVYTVSSYNPETKTVTLTSSLGHSREQGDFVGLYNRTITLDLSYYISYMTTSSGTCTFRGVWTNQTLGWINHVPTPPDDGIFADHLTAAAPTTREFHLGGRSTQYVVKDSTFYNSMIYWSQDTIFKDTVHIHNDTQNRGFISYALTPHFDNCWFQNATAVLYKPGIFAGLAVSFRQCKGKNLSIGAWGYYSAPFTAYNMDFAGLTPQKTLYERTRLYDCTVSTWSYYLSSATPNGTIESFNHNRVDGAYFAVLKGGTVQSQSDVVPPGKTRAYQYTLSNSHGMVHRKLDLGVLEPGDYVVVDVWLHKSTSMSHAPRVYLFNTSLDPLQQRDDTGKLVEYILPDEKINEWVKTRLTYKNTTGRVLPVSVRCEAKGDTGFVYEHMRPRKFKYNLI